MLRARRLAVNERVLADGSVDTPLSQKAIATVVAEVAALELEAVAVGSLHSYRNPRHEQMLADALRAALPQLAITVSSEVCPELREYERLSTALADAYVQPLMNRYLQRVEQDLIVAWVTCPVLMITSAGTMTTLDALADGEFVDRHLRANAKNRELLVRGLQSIGFSSLRSHKNFVLVRTQSAEQSR